MCLFPGCQAADAWNWTLIYIHRRGEEWVGLYLLSLTSLWCAHRELCLSLVTAYYVLQDGSDYRRRVTAINSTTNIFGYVNAFPNPSKISDKGTPMVTLLTCFRTCIQNVPGVYRGRTRLDPGQAIWDFWWNKWHWDRFSSEYCGFNLSASFHRTYMPIHSPIVDAVQAWLHQMTLSLNNIQK
jgi:hypothetical protein